ncbi:MAG: hypothetical protein PHV30_07650 [Candidatus Margulisbacteria bacterium]|nr:hypothetical protein [Candidatus Margulisiibacteriota bacterium]
MRNKIISLKLKIEKALFSAIDRYTQSNIKVFNNIDEALENIRFDELGCPENLYYIRSANIWIFGNHSWFYPLFKLMQYLGSIAAENNVIINFDQHKDFYLYHEEVDFSRWGSIPETCFSQKPVGFMNRVLKHYHENIGKTSFLFPLIWDGSLNTYVWRDGGHRLFKKDEYEELKFVLNPRLGFYMPPATAIWPKNRKEAGIKTVNSYELRNSPERNLLYFKANFNYVHTVDLDYFFRGSFPKGWNKVIYEGRVKSFRQDLRIIENNEGLYPQAVFIATTPDPVYVNGQLIPGVAHNVLNNFRFLEQTQEFKHLKVSAY